MVDIALLTEPTEGHSAGQHIVTVPAEEARGHEIGDLVRVTVTVQAYQEPEATPESPAAKA